MMLAIKLQLLFVFFAIKSYLGASQFSHRRHESKLEQDKVEINVFANNTRFVQTYRASATHTDLNSAVGTVKYTCF